MDYQKCSGYFREGRLADRQVGGQMKTIAELEQKGNVLPAAYSQTASAAVTVAQQAAKSQADMLAEVVAESDPCQVLTAGSGKQRSREAAVADKYSLTKAKPAHQAGSASQNRAAAADNTAGSQQDDDGEQASKLLEEARQRADARQCADAKAAAEALQAVGSKAPKDKAAKAHARALKAAAKAEKQAAKAKVGKQQSGAPASALTSATAGPEGKAAVDALAAHPKSNTAATAVTASKADSTEAMSPATAIATAKADTNAASDACAAQSKADAAATAASTSQTNGMKAVSSAMDVSSLAAHTKAASQTKASCEANTQALTIPAIHAYKTTQAGSSDKAVTGPQTSSNKQQQVGWGEQGGVSPSTPLFQVPTTAGERESSSSPSDTQPSASAASGKNTMNKPGNSSSTERTSQTASPAEGTQLTQQAAAQEASLIKGSAPKAAAAAPNKTCTSLLLTANSAITMTSAAAEHQNASGYFREGRLADRQVGGETLTIAELEQKGKALPVAYSQTASSAAVTVAQQAAKSQADMLAEVVAESDPCQVLTAGSGKQRSREAAVADKYTLSGAKPARQAGSAGQNRAADNSVGSQVDDGEQASKLLEEARQRADAKATAEAVQAVGSKAPKDKAAKAQARALKAAAKAEKQAAKAKVGKQQSGARATALTKASAKAETKAGALRAVSPVTATTTATAASTPKADDIKAVSSAAATAEAKASPPGDVQACTDRAAGDAPAACHKVSSVAAHTKAAGQTEASGQADTRIPALHPAKTQSQAGSGDSLVTGPQPLAHQEQQQVGKGEQGGVSHLPPVVPIPTSAGQPQSSSTSKACSDKLQTASTASGKTTLNKPGNSTPREQDSQTAGTSPTKQVTPQAADQEASRIYSSASKVAAALPGRTIVQAFDTASPASVKQVTQQAAAPEASLFKGPASTAFAPNTTVNAAAGEASPPEVSASRAALAITKTSTPRHTTEGGSKQPSQTPTPVQTELRELNAPEDKDQKQALPPTIEEGRVDVPIQLTLHQDTAQQNATQPQGKKSARANQASMAMPTSRSQQASNANVSSMLDHKQCQQPHDHR